ncbi:hypothetical protein ACTNED_09025 [Absicoccus porci]
MPRMTKRIIYITKLVKPYIKDGKIVEDAPQHIIDAWMELKAWGDMQDQ